MTRRFCFVMLLLIAVLMAASACAPTATPTAAPPTTAAPEPTEEPTTAAVSSVNIYLIALEDAGKSGKEVGCGDSVVAVAQEIEPTTAPLEAALSALLSIKEPYYGESGLYNALHQSDLVVERAAIEDGVAVVELSGTLMLGGVCDNPRVEAQLVETAMQFPGVMEAAITINGTPLEEALSLQ
jgi:spore germination protein GerM